MAQEKPIKKITQLSLEEYNKIKEKRAKSKLKVHFPWSVKIFLIFPIIIFFSLVLYYIFYIRYIAEH